MVQYRVDVDKSRPGYEETVNDLGDIEGNRYLESNLSDSKLNTLRAVVRSGDASGVGWIDRRDDPPSLVGGGGSGGGGGDGSGDTQPDPDPVDPLVVSVTSPAPRRAVVEWEATNPNDEALTRTAVFTLDGGRVTEQTFSIRRNTTTQGRVELSDVEPGQHEICVEIAR